jgi:acetone carboxylase, gamma subunit
MTRARITEYLVVDIESERWHCERCGHDLGSARDDYKRGCLVAERALEEVHPPVNGEGAFTFTPDATYCRLIEFYCPGCGVMIENEYLPPGHPLTRDIELDLDALRAKYGEGK